MHLKMPLWSRCPEQTSDSQYLSQPALLKVPNTAVSGTFGLRPRKPAVIQVRSFHLLPLKSSLSLPEALLSPAPFPSPSPPAHLSITSLLCPSGGLCPCIPRASSGCFQRTSLTTVFIKLPFSTPIPLSRYT